MALPLRLDAVIDDISCGAIIRHQTGDYNAVVLDYMVNSEGEFLIAARDDYDPEKRYDESLEDYTVFIVERLEDWMALTLGTDYALGEGE